MFVTRKRGRKRSDKLLERKGVQLLRNYRVTIIKLAILQIALDWRDISLFLRRCLAAGDAGINKKLVWVQWRLNFPGQNLWSSKKSVMLLVINDLESSQSKHCFANIFCFNMRTYTWLLVIQRLPYYRTYDESYDCGSHFAREDSVYRFNIYRQFKLNSLLRWLYFE